MQIRQTLFKHGIIVMFFTHPYTSNSIPVNRQIIPQVCTKYNS